MNCMNGDEPTGLYELTYPHYLCQNQSDETIQMTHHIKHFSLAPYGPVRQSRADTSHKQPKGNSNVLIMIQDSMDIGIPAWQADLFSPENFVTEVHFRSGPQKLNEPRDVMTFAQCACVSLLECDITSIITKLQLE